MLPRRTQRSSEGQRSLPGRYFTSVEIYDRESALLGEGWLAVGPERRFARGATPLEVEGQRLLAIRDRQDRLRVVHNVCRHRGTILCEEPCLDRRRIVCPYHGWSYELDGSLASAPNMDGIDDFALEDHALIEVGSTVWQGILFVCLEGSGGGSELSERLGPLMEVVAPWRLEELAVVGERRYQVGANWKLLFQNYSECYHCPTLHPPLNRLTPFLDSDNLFDEGSILGGPMRLADPDGSMTSNGKRCAAPLPGLRKSEAAKVYYFTVFPNLFLSLHPDYVMIHQLDRIGIDHTRVECWWLAAEGADAEAFKPAIEFWDRTNREDWWICEQMQRGVNSPAYEPGPYSDLESLVAAFDRNYLRLMGDGG